MFEKFEENPTVKVITRGKRKGQTYGKGDCVVRAFQKLWGLDWQTTAKKLFDKALEMYDLPDCPGVWRSFLKKSTKYQTFISDANKKKCKTVSDFAKETEGDEKTYICHVASHLVAVSNGKYFDSWDSGKYRVRSIWEKAE